MKQIHLVIPFSRPELKDKLIEAYRPMGVILHLIMFQDELTDFPQESWIRPFVIPSRSQDCKVKMPGTFKRNWFIENCEIIDNDYYVTADDDDMYEAGVFDAAKQMDDDIVIISMQRGNNIPDDAPPIRRYPTDTLYARPEFVEIGGVSAQQSFVKGRIFKDHLHNEESHNWDGELAVHHRESGEQIAYRPNLFALFNYFEPGRWDERRKMLSIVIPVYNQFEMTGDCIDAISNNTQNYEIIIVDNGSTPPARIAHGASHPNYIVTGAIENYHIIRNETNQGFPIAVNQGIREAKGDTIVVLNNDVIVSKGWAFWLEYHLKEYAIVGPVTNYCAGKQRVTLPIYNNEEELAVEAEKWSREHAGESEEVAFIIGFCMAFKKALFDEIGLFDTALWPCSGEEIDYCHRARAAGYKVGIAKETYVHHFGSQTFQDLERAGQVKYSDVITRNDAHLANRWGPDAWVQEVRG